MQNLLPAASSDTRSNKLESIYPIVVLEKIQIVNITRIEENEENNQNFENQDKQSALSVALEPYHQICNNIPAFAETDFSERVQEPVDKETMSDSDYNPADYDQSSESSFEYTKDANNNSGRSIKNISKESTDLEISVNIPGKAACNDEEMFVLPRSSKIKKKICIYCKKLQTKIARHLESKHADQDDVKKFSVLPKGCRERKLIIDTIRKKGDFLHNIDENLNKGELTVCRRPTQENNRKATDYAACSNCKGFFSKKTLRHHFDQCNSKKKKKGSRSVTIMGRAVTARIHNVANDVLKKIVFPVMREDKYTRLIRYDKLIILYANELCIKYKPQHQHDLIRARIRLLAKFLSALKQINKEVTDFASLYEPKYYDDCIAAVNVIAGFDSEQNIYRVSGNRVPSRIPQLERPILRRKLL
ncbi:uncharacterized protein [Prorops nasuta]|uniref:uncharacterized protein n=1 Tax=Prorops nasuta TaxID=863751 RepID=UPI0034CF0EDF